MTAYSDYYFVLNGREVVPTNDPQTWAKNFESNDRRVGTLKTERYTVSTVFIGLNHNFGDEGPPLIFETMIFGGPLDQEYCERCSTYDEAEAMHEKAVKVAKWADRLRFFPKRWWLGWIYKLS